MLIAGCGKQQSTASVRSSRRGTTVSLAGIAGICKREKQAAKEIDIPSTVDAQTARLYVQARLGTLAPDLSALRNADTVGAAKGKLTGALFDLDRELSLLDQLINQPAPSNQNEAIDLASYRATERQESLQWASLSASDCENMLMIPTRMLIAAQQAPVTQVTVTTKHGRQPPAKAQRSGGSGLEQGNRPHTTAYVSAATVLRSI